MPLVGAKLTSEHEPAYFGGWALPSPGVGAMQVAIIVVMARLATGF